VGFDFPPLHAAAQQKNQRRHNNTNPPTTAPMTIPAIAPPDRPEEEDEEGVTGGEERETTEVGPTGKEDVRLGSDPPVTEVGLDEELPLLLLMGGDGGFVIFAMVKI
jgi:hypothetical protein